MHSSLEKYIYTLKNVLIYCQKHQFLQKFIYSLQNLFLHSEMHAIIIFSFFLIQLYYLRYLCFILQKKNKKIYWRLWRPLTTFGDLWRDFDVHSILTETRHLNVARLFSENPNLLWTISGNLIVQKLILFHQKIIYWLSNAFISWEMHSHIEKSIHLLPNTSVTTEIHSFIAKIIFTFRDASNHYFFIFFNSIVISKLSLIHS